MTTGVLAMLELDGDVDALLAAFARIDESLPRPQGMLARIVAATETGVVLFQLWESAEARARHAEDEAHHAALAESGLFEHVGGRRSRTFERAELTG